MENIIFNNKEIRISVSQIPSTKAIELLENTTFGNKGIKYQHTELLDTLTDLINPYFFYLYSENELVGFYCLCKRQIDVNKNLINGFYGRYLTIKYFGNGFGKLIKREAIKYIESIYPSPVLFYSYIEQNNVHSLNISLKQHFKPVAKIKSIIFFRFFPKWDKNVKVLSKEELPIIKDILQTYYQTHSLLLLENIGYKGNYYTYKINGEIIAGLQANPVVWNIIKLDGFLGKIIKYLDYIPFLNKIISTKYKFLAIEGVFLKEGVKIDVLYALLESVLSSLKFNTALLQLDYTDNLLIPIESDDKLGLVNKLSPPVTTLLMVKSKDEFGNSKPIYISSFDFA